MAISVHPNVRVPGIEGESSVGWRTSCSRVAVLEGFGADISEATVGNDGAEASATTAWERTARLGAVVGRAYLLNYGAERDWVSDDATARSPSRPWYVIPILPSAPRVSRACGAPGPVGSRCRWSVARRVRRVLAQVRKVHAVVSPGVLRQTRHGAREPCGVPAPFDSLGVVSFWLDEPPRLAALNVLTFVPGPSRLAKHCLAPLVRELVEPVPLATVEHRILTLLDAAEVALFTDLRRANATIDDILDAIQQQVCDIRLRELLTASDIQDRVAITLRGVWLPHWREWTDDQGLPVAPFRPVWGATPPALERSLFVTARLRRCKAWASAAGAGDELTFTRRWKAEIRAAVAAADPASHSPNAVSLGLGELHVPRIADDPPQPYEWRLATDRSFYTRVQMYWDGKHLPRDLSVADPGAAPPEDRFADAPAPGEALIRESIRRTLSPVGLFRAEHQTLIQAVVHAVQDAVANPGVGGGEEVLAQAWASTLASSIRPYALEAAIRAHASARLARAAGVDSQTLDESVYAQCVTRRLWIRLHAWELVGSRIPPRALVRDLNIALDQSLTAAGVRRDAPTPVTPDFRRSENTMRVIDEIMAELTTGPRVVAAEADPPEEPEDRLPRPGAAAVLAEYTKRYALLKHDPILRRNGGIHPPRWLQRKIEFEGEDV